MHGRLRKILQTRPVVALIIVVSAMGLSTSARMIWNAIRPASLTVTDSGRSGHSDEEDLGRLAPESCTIFTAAYGGTVLFGNNEDYISPKTYYWVVPAGGAKKHGCIVFGFDNFFGQGGINDKGLAFDGNALPDARLNRHPGLPPFPGNFGQRILEQCATVEEALQWVRQYSWGDSLRWQLHLADASGDAAVISAGVDGEWAITRKKQGDGHLVSTNFNSANPTNGHFPCPRYETATKRLEQLKGAGGLTVDYVRSILDATRQEGARVNTVYSNIFDLRQGLVYLYHWHQFEEVVVIKVAEELAKAPSPTPIRNLFSKQTVDRATTEYERYQGKAKLRQ